MYVSSEKILNAEQLKSQLKVWRLRGFRVVFTNGCFDLLHPGHLDYLEKARAMGHCLVVGLNSDASVRRLKGEGRPLLPQDSRARMLAALGFVDAVVLFEEDTPIRLIRAVMPDVLVKGGDYVAESVVGYEDVTGAGGEVRILPFLEGYSTTALIEKIRKG
jgi:rfaE bifunctional protein nucleotidyltransferase chain/domain